ncbi:MAG: hypothetical protein WBE76_18215 [Terracidiphilus sp.]
MPPLWWAANEVNQHRSGTAASLQLFVPRRVPAIPRMSLPPDYGLNFVTVLTDASISRCGMRILSAHTEPKNNSSVSTSD